MTAETANKTLQRMALDDLSSSPSLTPVLKPGESLAPDSGYPEKFITDYNAFQAAYKDQHDSNPAYWDRGHKWWSEVRDHIDQMQQTNQDQRRAGAIDKLFLHSQSPDLPVSPTMPTREDFNGKN